jgi:nucleotide-binding universal stress UspA family protein
MKSVIDVVDNVVVGSRGHGLIKRALLGSTSTYLAHHADCNVIIARKQQKQNDNDEKNDEKKQ